MPDNMIKTNILNEMKLVSAIKEPDRIKVRVDKGQVFLDGTVSYKREKKMMRTLVSWHKGVKAIVNNLEVLPPRKAQSDGNLTKVLEQIMKYEFPTQKNVAFTVTNGRVELYGQTETMWAKRHIAEKFSEIIGISKVENNLVVDSEY
jgi:osmotically-inducible protein OsmY